jgi:aldoxime dehydratase
MPPHPDELESGIAPHLVTDRTIPGRRPADFTPPYPSFSARFDPAITQVVMAYYGVQYRMGDVPAVVADALAQLAVATTLADGPVGCERARYVDEAGFRTVVTILYWTDPEAWRRWRAAAPAWTDPDRYTPDAGFFVEVAAPTVQRFETLFSSGRSEGVSVASTGLSGDIAEHAYWGGARDRMPAAQTDLLKPKGAPTVVHDGKLSRVIADDNVCLIRSGQEWSETDGDERRLYLSEVEPTLRAGMEFLRDEGRSVGCFVNRYMRVLDPQGRETDKSFGMSWWRSLADLETWSASHSTHKAIFGAAMRYLSTMGPSARLRLYHEITVATGDQLEFEYLGCHERTGMLRAEATSS